MSRMKLLGTFPGISRCALAFGALQSHRVSTKPQVPIHVPNFHSVMAFSSSGADNESDAIAYTIATSNSNVDWDDRIALQDLWSNEAKGWKVKVEWKQTPFGAGLFAAEDIPAETILRLGRSGRNLLQFRCIHDIEAFCKADNDGDEDLYQSRLMYAKDYLYAFNPNADPRGYDIPTEDEAEKLKTEQERFFGVWVPGNGLNHNPEPNTVYRPAEGGTKVGIDLVALRDIEDGEELFDDYRRHGKAPQWLLGFSEKYKVSLNFAGCNDFVEDA